MKNSSVQDVLKMFSEGGLVLIHDGLDSDNKAHLITSAEKITEESYKAWCYSVDKDVNLDRSKLNHL